MMLQALVLPEIRELIATGDSATLHEVLDHWLPVDIASMMDKLSNAEDVAVFKLLRGPQRVRIFEYLDREAQQRLQAAAKVPLLLASDFDEEWSMAASSPIAEPRWKMVPDRATLVLTRGSLPDIEPF